MENKWKEALEAEADKYGKDWLDQDDFVGGWYPANCGFQAGAEWAKGWIEANVVSSVPELDFAVWYSGMDKEKVLKAYKRWQEEKGIVVEPKNRKEVVDVLKEAVEYLGRVVYQDGKPQYLNRINATSILHNKMKAAVANLQKGNDVNEPSGRNIDSSNSVEQIRKFWDCDRAALAELQRKLTAEEIENDKLKAALNKIINGRSCEDTSERLSDTEMARIAKDALNVEQNPERSVATKVQ